jgi:hypothetical protein
MDPAYQMVAVNTLAPVRASTAGGSDTGLVDPRYASHTQLPAPRRSRRAIIVISAVIAVILGIVALAVLSKRGATSPSESPAPTAPAKTSAIHAPPSAMPPGAMAAASTATVALAAPSAVPAEPGAPPAPTAAAPATTTTAAAPATACFASVSSLPAGAEIVVDQNVVGTTPQKLALPCGAPVELTVRKPRLVPATRTVTPTPDGAVVRVALTKLTFQVKVSSQPAGAAITLNGKSLGVTPTTVKVPAFEASSLVLAKDGYAPETETITPRANGVAVHSQLKRRSR